MDGIEPALTPEQWRSLAAPGGFAEVELVGESLMADGYVELTQRHAVAALALHAQPFGFSWEDVDRLRALAHHSGGRPPAPDPAAAPAWAESLAARIAALLPPRG